MTKKHDRSERIFAAMNTISAAAALGGVAVLMALWMR